MSKEKKDKFQVDVRDLKPSKEAKGGVGREYSVRKQPMPRMNG